MKSRKINKSRLALAITAGTLGALAQQAVAAGFIEDSKASLTLRNFYINTDNRNGSASPSKQEEWGQGFILNYQSGFTQGTVGFGVDALPARPGREPPDRQLHPAAAVRRRPGMEKPASSERARAFFIPEPAGAICRLDAAQALRGAGCCWVMQWMLPPPRRISRPGTITTSCSGNTRWSIALASASLGSSKLGATMPPLTIRKFT